MTSSDTPAPSPGNLDDGNTVMPPTTSRNAQLRSNQGRWPVARPRGMGAVDRAIRKAEPLRLRAELAARPRRP